jgi:broad specificity phosphatase PhoE
MKPLDRPTLLVVGSCECEADADGLFPGWIDYELTARGHAQAVAVYITQFEIPLHHIYCNTLSRSKCTAEYISRRTGVQITQTDSLAPWDVGRLAGELITQEREAELAEYRDNLHLPIPDGEPYVAFLSRWSRGAMKAANYVCEHSQKALVLVTEQDNLETVSEIWSAMQDTSEAYQPGCLVRLAERL